MKKTMILAAVLLAVMTAPMWTQTLVPGDNVADKMAWLRAFAQTGGNYIIEVRANETISDEIILSSGGKSNITITLRGIGANRTLNTRYDGMFTVGSGVTLVLDNNITLTGGSSSHMVNVDGGALIMNNGTVITGAEDLALLFGKTGGGVKVKSGSFTMNGGTISGNKVGAVGKGGGVGLSGGTFTMNGGTISGNSTGANGCGLHDERRYHLR